MTATLIRQGRIVTAVDDYVADLLLDRGRVVAIGETLPVGSDVRVVDAHGLVVLPGGVDCHTHMENTFGESATCDTFESGTRAAAFGGTTTIVDFAFQRRDASVLEAIRSAQEKAQGKAVVDYGFHVITTHVDDAALADMQHAIRHEG